MMERRLMQDFKIDFVEGVVAGAVAEGKSGDVFGNIAKALGKKPTRGSRQVKSNKPEDWNAIAKRTDSKKDLIGSVKYMDRKNSSQQSLRRYMIEHRNSDVKDIDKNIILQYNPQLIDASAATKVAYMKFKTRKLKKEYDISEKEEYDTSTTASSAVRQRPVPTKVIAPKAVEKSKDVIVDIEPPRSSNAPSKMTSPPMNTQPAAPPKKDQNAPSPSDTKPQNISVDKKAPSRDTSPAPSSAPKPVTPQEKKPTPPVQKPVPKPAPKPTVEASKPAPSKTVTAPLAGKSKVSGRVVEGWL